MNTIQVISSQVTIEKLDPMRVACCSTISHEPETEGRNFLLNWLERRGQADQPGSDPVRLFGFDIEVTQAQKDAGLRGYEVWASVPEWIQPSGGVTIKKFPGGVYAAVLLENPFDDPYGKIPPSWKALHEWVICSDSYRGANHQWLEEYIPQASGAGLKLYYPVKPVGAKTDRPQ